ncbi:Protein of unknown function (DUF3558) [Streptoalloteichus tenebrarius]|uniref:DUF3558 domain-containing protein n=1 Tax=Streptoalloteichus tenebrarius (strain ATCC 17920 / DSM 40477 / JCM 4838 / CBS 697.72 / NBRC 16177 / NCIMB 11028 / NRRL B-12390 / A12253. 1 / ISP 5477) TaxID=1933 RepID=A0ABT1I165_STRSD|nr:Protein of unknown function (DUF3558) [Streptoalloteichus tenebrarius]
MPFLALLATACSSRQGAELAGPATTPTTTSASSSPGSASSSARPGSPASAAPSAVSVSDTDPCALVDPAVVAELGLPAGRRGTFGGKPECQFRAGGATGGRVMVDPGPGAGLDQLRPRSGDEVTSLDLAGRPARQEAAPNQRTCSVLVAFGSEASVTVDMSTRSAGEGPPACEVARKVAESVARRLPGQG